MKIALAGKGGTGKTTLTALLIRYLAWNYPDRSILAVDADANANLNEALGLPVEGTISSILEQTKQSNSVPTGMTRDMFIKYQLNRAMVETERYDLLVMGNPLGPGCYCFPNDLLKKYLEKLSDKYHYVVTDNEAGLEHLSRKVLPAVNLMVITSDLSARGVRTAGRIREIIGNVRIEAGRMGLVITRGRPEDLEKLQGEIKKTGLELWGVIPHDPLVEEYDLYGKPLLEMPDQAASVIAAESLFGKLLS
ncbi:MAG TPA: AAA family ATPase [Firmicutes bacterium]|nr:AAA family ATPase [Bacillota bacterium]